MQLTHEQATHTEVTPYLQSMAHPVPVLSIYGCCSKLEADPSGKARNMPSQQAVYYGWLDGLLAVLSDTSFPEDTLFCIFEEDWRLSAAHTTIERLLKEAKRPAEGEARADHSWRAERSRSPGPRPGSSTDPRPLTYSDVDVSRDAEPSAGAAERGGSQRFAAPRAQLGPKSCPQWLTDMVGFANVAHKHNVGDVVWQTWAPGTGKRTQKRPAHASTCIFLTRKAALKLREHLGHIEGWHLDVLLRRLLLVEQTLECGLKSSWVWPAVGSHAAHLSGCDDRVGQRASTFDKPYSQSGTRPCPVENKQERVLYTWGQSNDKQELDIKVCHLQGMFAKTSPWWRTWHRDAKYRNTEMDNGKIRERQQCEPWFNDKYQPVLGAEGLAPEAAEKVAMTWLHGEADGPPTKGRQKRNWRKAANAYVNHRVFTYSEVGQAKTHTHTSDRSSTNTSRAKHACAEMLAISHTSP